MVLIPSFLDRPNWQDWGGRWGRRTAFMRHLKVTMEELDVKYSMPVQPILMHNRPAFTNQQSSPKSPGFKPTRQTSAGIASMETLGDAGPFQRSTLSRASTRGPGPANPGF